MSHHVQCGGLPLTLRNDPVFDSNAAARVRIRPARNIASGKYSFRARFKIGIHDDSALDGNPRFYSKINSGADTDTSNDEISFENVTAL